MLGKHPLASVSGNSYELWNVILASLHHSAVSQFELFSFIGFFFLFEGNSQYVCIHEATDSR